MQEDARTAGLKSVIIRHGSERKFDLGCHKLNSGSVFNWSTNGGQGLNKLRLSYYWIVQMTCRIIVRYFTFRLFLLIITDLKSCLETFIANLTVLTYTRQNK